MVIIEKTIKTGIYVEFNSDNTSAHKKTFKINGIVSNKTSLLKHENSTIEQTHDYEVISHYTNFIDKELYNDLLLLRNKQV